MRPSSSQPGDAGNNRRNNGEEDPPSNTGEISTNLDNEIEFRSV